METNLVLTAVRKSNRLFITLGIVVLIVVAVGAALDEHNLLSFFSGPREMATQDLIEVKDADQLSQVWVTVKGTDVFDTGWDQYTEDDSGSKTIDSSYAGLAVGKHYLLIQIPGTIDENTLPKTYTGSLTNIPSDLDEQVIADIRTQNADAAARFLPVMLDTSDFRSGVYLSFVWIGIGALIGLVLLLIGLRRTINPYSHPIMKALARYGDPHTLSDSISQEMMLSTTPVAKGFTITRNWLVFNKGNFQAARLQDITWAYQFVLRHRTYGITTRRTYEVRVWDQQGKMMTYSGSEAEVLAGLQEIARSASWAVVGYTKELDHQWRKNRVDFLAMVSARRQ